MIQFKERRCVMKNSGIIFFIISHYNSRHVSRGERVQLKSKKKNMLERKQDVAHNFWLHFSQSNDQHKKQRSVAYILHLECNKTYAKVIFYSRPVIRHCFPFCSCTVIQKEIFYLKNNRHQGRSGQRLKGHVIIIFVKVGHVFWFFLKITFHRNDCANDLALGSTAKLRLLVGQ